MSGRVPGGSEAVIGCSDVALLAADNMVVAV